MTLENIYYIGQTVAVIAILASLIGIFYQGYQTNKIARAELTQSTWLQTGVMQTSLFDTPEKAELMHRVLFETGPITDVERLRLDAYLSIAVGTHEAAFNLHRRGLIEDGAYNRIAANTPRYMRVSTVRRWWRRRRGEGADPGFVALVDAIVEKYEAAETNASASQENTS